jgi:GNAT superfamily N-acetyltransferase
MYPTMLSRRLSIQGEFRDSDVRLDFPACPGQEVNMNANTPASPVYRRMQPRDIEPVLALSKNSLPYVDLASIDTDANDYTSLYLMSGLTFEELTPVDPDSPLAMYFVAEIDKKIAGFVLAYFHYIGIPAIKICNIHAIVVDPDYHGQGIGAQLINRLQKQCKEDDIKIMRFLIRQNNPRLQDYIGSLGFKQSNVLIFDKIGGE